MLKCVRSKESHFCQCSLLHSVIHPSYCVVPRSGHTYCLSLLSSAKRFSKKILTGSSLCNISPIRVPSVTAVFRKAGFFINKPFLLRTDDKIKRRCARGLFSRSGQRSLWQYFSTVVRRANRAKQFCGGGNSGLQVMLLLADLLKARASAKTVEICALLQSLRERRPLAEVSKKSSATPTKEVVRKIRLQQWLQQFYCHY